VSELDFDLTAAPDAQGGSRVTLRGELDLGSAPQLEQALAAVDGEVVLDLSGLTFMDSTAVRVLLETAEQRGRDLRIVPPPGGDARVTIEETGIARLLPLTDEEGP